MKSILAFFVFALSASVFGATWEGYALGTGCPADEWHHLFGERFKAYEAALYSGYYVTNGNPQGEHQMVSGWGTSHAFIQSSTNVLVNNYLFYLGAKFPDACTFHAPAWECFSTHLYGEYSDHENLNKVDSIKMSEGMVKALFQVQFDITDGPFSFSEVTSSGAIAEQGPDYPEFFGPGNGPVINPGPLGPPTVPWDSPIKLAWNGTPNVAMSVSASTTANTNSSSYSYITNLVTDATGVGTVDFPYTNSAGFFRVTYTNSP